jgi:DNA-binding MarR family transcriptional regulator
MSERDMKKMENCICFNLRRITRTFTQFLDLELRKQGIRSTQTPILQALCHKDWSMTELSDFLGMDRTTLIRNLRPLQRDGFLEISGGGRGRHVELKVTTQGRKLVESFTPAWRAAQDKIVNLLGYKKWSSVLDDLEVAASALKK